MIESWVLIKGKFLEKEDFRPGGYMNAKHLVVGSVPGSGIMLHVAANSVADLRNALLKFAEVPGVAEVLTLAIETRQ
jgi:hypothetical protein